MITNINILLQNLPQKIGIYFFFDKNKKIIYIGKSINIKVRVLSYFKSENHKIRLLAKRIVDIKYTLVDTESDALLLESNLIKKYSPIFNINLKDDSSYPWICITKETFPRIFKTRNPNKENSFIFGPYANVKTADTLLKSINDIYPIHTSNYKINSKNINRCIFKSRLVQYIEKFNYHSKSSLEDVYSQVIIEVKKMMSGNTYKIIKQLQIQMLKYANDWEFEKAQGIKEKLALLKNYQAKSTIVSNSVRELNVFSIKSDNSMAFVNFFNIKNGAIIQSYNMKAKKKLDESDKDILSTFILNVRKKFNLNTKEICVSTEIDFKIDNTNIFVPKIGDKKKLISLSLKNAFEEMKKHYDNIKIINPDQYKSKLLEQVKNDLQLKKLPYNIECFDNSNISGTNPVSACVVFKNTIPSNKDYRLFNIKNVSGIDDFKSMEEVVFRRYKRILDENKKLPDLIIIDGGKGQLSSTCKAMKKLNLEYIDVISIAKRLEEIFKPNDNIPIYIDKRSPSLKLIQTIRNEAHRFALTFHKNKRSKNLLSSQLDNIKGIGEKTKNKNIN